ncbi:MAG TPA: LacI family DNA-binding transcriptional regulator [Oceanipulchritudo sp.]|nr:LacI family DNA-binding transcriptional regulator [Oceanipulchritudo sp.]
MKNKRVTLRDIASACGYHFSTVSLALRGDPSIPEATRCRIKDIASELGYSPDPVLSALVAYRQKRTSPDYAGTIIWLTNNSPGFHWRGFPHNRDYFSGAEKEAKERGFVLEELDLGTPGMNPARANQILNARRINCLLVPPQQLSSRHMELDWNRYFAVALGYSLPIPHLHLTSINHAGMMEELMEKLLNYGYQRPGLVLMNSLDQLAERKLAAAYLGELYRNDGFISMAPLCIDTWNPETFDRWFEEQKPDVLIGSSLVNPELLPHLSTMGLRAPDDIGYADFNLSWQENRYAGMKQNAEVIGGVAVSDLIRLFHRNECGPLEGAAHQTLLDGTWYAGPTLREQKRQPGIFSSSGSSPGIAAWESFGRRKERCLRLKSG